MKVRSVTKGKLTVVNHSARMMIDFAPGRIVSIDLDKEWYWAPYVNALIAKGKLEVVEDTAPTDETAQEEPAKTSRRQRWRGERSAENTTDVISEEEKEKYDE